MVSGIYLNESVWSSPLVWYNKKQNRRVVDLRWKKRAGSCYQKLHSYYQITARPRHPEEEEQEEEEEEEEGKEEQQKGEMRFFENIFSLNFLTFWLKLLVQERSKSVLSRNFV